MVIFLFLFFQRNVAAISSLLVVVVVCTNKLTDVVVEHRKAYY